MSKKTTVKTGGRRKRPADRVIIDDLTSRTSKPKHAGAHVYVTYALLRHMNKRVTEAWIAGVSGDAWRIVFTTPSFIYSDTPYVGAAQMVTRALRRIGYQCQYRPVGEPEDEISDIIATLRDDRPIIIHHYPQSNDWGLLCGFNRRRRKLYYWDGSGRGDQPAELDQEEVLEGAGIGLLYLIGEQDHPTRKEMFLDSLLEATQWAKTGLQPFEEDTQELYYSGFTAYQHWVSWLRTPASRLSSADEAVTYAHIVAETAYSRSMAPAFIRQGMRLLRSEADAVEMLESAADEYDQVAECFDELADMFPVQSPTLENLRKAAQLVQQARTAERLGLAHITRALRAMDLVDDE